MRALLLLLLVLASPIRALAQAPVELTLTEAQAATVAGDASDEAALALELAELRVADRQARIDEGWVLVGYGGASIATGAVLAVIGEQARDERLLWAGLGTLGWGAINAIFSVFLMDLDGSGARSIEAGRSARGADLVAAREDAARAQWNTAAVIALNAGLDVFYIATGILLAILGDAAGPGDWTFGGREGLIGYGAAMATQGGGLLIYDVVTWLFAQDRGDRLMRLGR